MTIGGVSAPAWPWAWAVLGLALYGLGDLCWWAAGGLRRVRWWLRDRVRPLLEDDDELMGLPPGMGLPPERTWEQMTSHQLPVVGPTQEGRTQWPTHSLRVVSSDNLGPRQERRMPGWEAESRQAYAALDLEYPSGLLARVREAAQ